MGTLTILRRNVMWRLHNAFTVVITILQPMLWLLLYSTVAGQAMGGGGNYTAFVLPGLCVLVSFGACSSCGMMNYLMKRDGSFYRVLISPVGRGSIVLGHILEGVLCTFFEVLIMAVVGMFFSVSFAGGVTGVMVATLIVFMTAFFMAGLCYGISLRLPDEAVYETVMNAVVLPVFFLSTALFPADALTGAAKVAVNLNPFTYIVNVLRELIIIGSPGLKDIIGLLVLLTIMCGLSLVWALSGLKREMS